MRKRLIVCLDGTGQDTEIREGSTTNVLLLRRALLPEAAGDIKQVVRYEGGLHGLTPEITGQGLSEIVQRAYEFLTDHYVKGDDIYVFGFSRGAYAARSLSSFTALLGIIPKTEMDCFDMAWQYYQEESTNPKDLENDVLRDLARQGQILRDFEDPRRQLPSVQEEEQGIRYEYLPLHLVGVWDTVGAARWGGFHDVHLAWNVTHAYQALALHEVRKPFRPHLWSFKRPYQEVAQVWFPGAHSDVGGGEESVSLSSEPLSWMIQKARRCRLEFDEEYLADVLKPIPSDDVSFPMSMSNPLLSNPLFSKVADIISPLVLKTREIGKEFDDDGDRKHASLGEYQHISVQQRLERLGGEPSYEKRGKQLRKADLRSIELPLEPLIRLTCLARAAAEKAQRECDDAIRVSAQIQSLSDSPKLKLMGKAVRRALRLAKVAERSAEKAVRLAAPADAPGASYERNLAAAATEFACVARNAAKSANQAVQSSVADKNSQSLWERFGKANERTDG